MASVAFVTGVSRGLGEALAAELLGRGWEVVGIGRRASARLSAPSFRLIACDLAEPAAAELAVAPVFAETAARSPEAVVLINSAATASPLGVTGALAGGDLMASLAVNLTAPYVLANAFCRAFTDDAVDRRIINVSSGAAQVALPAVGPYCVAKAALEMLAKVMAAERRAPSFRVIALRPGVIDTDMQRFMRSQSKEVLPDVALFQGFHANGQLVSAGAVAAKVVQRLVLEPIEHGRTYSEGDL